MFLSTVLMEGLIFLAVRSFDEAGGVRYVWKVLEQCSVVSAQRRDN